MEDLIYGDLKWGINANKNLMTTKRQKFLMLEVKIIFFMKSVIKM